MVIKTGKVIWLAQVVIETGKVIWLAQIVIETGKVILLAQVVIETGQMILLAQVVNETSKVIGLKAMLIVSGAEQINEIIDQISVKRKIWPASLEGARVIGVHSCHQPHLHLNRTKPMISLHLS
jgi:hypothetical protein